MTIEAAEINAKLTEMAARIGRLADLFEARGMNREGVAVLRMVERDCLEFRGDHDNAKLMDLEIMYMAKVLEALRQLRRTQIKIAKGADHEET